MLSFHWWLFFGKTISGSVTGISLFGGISLFITTNLPLDFFLAKFVSAIICVVLDRILISEVLGLGWFKWTSGNREG